MVTVVTEKRVLNCREVETEYDGCWFLYDQREFPPVEDKGYVVAYGDGTPEDRDVLEEICFEKYHGKVLLKKGWLPKDEIFDNGIIEII